MHTRSVIKLSSCAHSVEMKFGVDKYTKWNLWNEMIAITVKVKVKLSLYLIN
jgi:hypothetical protein